MSETNYRKRNFFRFLLGVFGATVAAILLAPVVEFFRASSAELPIRYGMTVFGIIGMFTGFILNILEREIGILSFRKSVIAAVIVNAVMVGVFLVALLLGEGFSLYAVTKSVVIILGTGFWTGSGYYFFSKLV